MTIRAILLPVFVQVGLTFCLLFWMGRRRVAALRSREVAMADIALGQSAWPKEVTQVGNAYHNQLQVPVLFYVAVILAMATRKADLLFVALEWLFVASRFAHAFIHVTSNRVQRRFAAFVFGVAVLALMWIALAVGVLLAV